MWNKSGHCLFQNTVLDLEIILQRLRKIKENRIPDSRRLRWDPNGIKTRLLAYAVTWLGVTTTKGSNGKSSKISNVIRLLWKRGCDIAIGDVDRLFINNLFSTYLPYSYASGKYKHLTQDFSSLTLPAKGLTYPTSYGTWTSVSNSTWETFRTWTDNGIKSE